MVNWIPDKDALLLIGIFEFMDIKTSGALLDHLAKKVGEGCTPKAVSHRLNIMKKKGAAAGGPVTPSKATATATPKSTPKTKGTPKLRAGRSKVIPEDDEDDMQSPSIGMKRGRTTTPMAKLSGTPALEFKDEDEDQAVKKIKVERTDDEDAGYVVLGDLLVEDDDD